MSNMYGRRQTEVSWHDVAQVCLNGHVVNQSSKKSPQFSKEFCEKCGSKTITTCPACTQEIQGKYHAAGVVSFSVISAPAFCQKCGKEFPWTAKRLQAAKDLADELDELSEQDRETFKKSLDDIVRDNPQTPVAATRMKKLSMKMGKAGGSALLDVVKELATQAAKDILFGKS